MTFHPKPSSESLRADLAGRLRSALKRVAWTLPEAASDRIGAYLVELLRWNRAYNLTAVTEPAAMIERHVLDSLSIRPHLRGRRILDAGTGAGIPGLILAIAEPGRQFALVDANRKKIRFLNHVARSLDLGNVQAVHARLESLSLDPGPDELVARALAPLPRLVEWLGPWIDSGARLLAMKGRLAESERLQVPDAYNVSIQPLDWPGREGARCLVVVSPGGSD
jgi:16S rRNA (guanine527-N7)-methyltransferase